MIGIFDNLYLKSYNVSSMIFILLSVRSEDQFLSYEVFSDKKWVVGLIILIILFYKSAY